MCVYKYEGSPGKGRGDAAVAKLKTANEIIAVDRTRLCVRVRTAGRGGGVKPLTISLVNQVDDW